MGSFRQVQLVLIAIAEMLGLNIVNMENGHMPIRKELAVVEKITGGP